MGEYSNKHFIFGKTFMEGAVLAEWLKIKDFKDGIDRLIENNKDVNDASILRLIEEVISKHIDEEDDSFPMDWAIKSAENFRKRIPKAYFDKDWLKATYPALWDEISSLKTDGNMVIIPFQMHRFLVFLKLFTEKVTENELEIKDIHLDKDSAIIKVTVSFKSFRLDKHDQLLYVLKNLKVCNALIITTVHDHTEITLSIPDVIMPKDEYQGEKRRKKAWTLQWNQHYITNDEESPFQDENPE